MWEEVVKKKTTMYIERLRSPDTLCLDEYDTTHYFYGHDMHGSVSVVNRGTALGGRSPCTLNRIPVCVNSYKWIPNGLHNKNRYESKQYVLDEISCSLQGTLYPQLGSDW